MHVSAFGFVSDAICYRHWVCSSTTTECAVCIAFGIPRCSGFLLICNYFSSGLLFGVSDLQIVEPQRTPQVQNTLIIRPPRTGWPAVCTLSLLSWLLYLLLNLQCGVTVAGFCFLPLAYWRVYTCYQFLDIQCFCPSSNHTYRIHTLKFHTLASRITANAWLFCAEAGVRLAPGIRMQASASSSPTSYFGVLRLYYSIFVLCGSPHRISLTVDIFSSCDFRSLSRAIRIYVERISSSACCLENQWWSQSRRPRQTIDSHQLSKSCA